MELWFLYAILSAIFAGLYSFFLKVSAEKNHNGSLVTTYSMFSCAFIALIFLIFNNKEGISWLYILIISFANGFFYFLAVQTRIESLKNIHTTLYFPIYKTLGPILMVGVGLIGFKESLSFFETIGIILGIIVPLLLITKSENNRQVNLKKGLILLVIGTIFGVLSSTTAKIITFNQYNILLFLVISFIFGGFFSLYNYNKSKHLSKHSLIRLKEIGILNGTVLFLATYFFTKSTFGNLAIVYTINSFSIIVTILLAILIYKEHFDLKKFLAVVLTIASLFFFQ